MKRTNIFLAFIAAAAFTVGCTDEPNPDYTPKEPAPEIVPADRTAFAKGADISWTTQLESEGHTFANAAGTTTECTALMKELGMNAIRLRVWVDPADGWSSKGDVLIKARRAQALGMRLMIDFHYSDWWADPGKQLIPAAWVDYDADQMAKAVADHTTEVLTLLKENGVDVEWVQVGNETTHGMLIHRAIDSEGRGTDESPASGGISTNPANYARYTTAGYNAVKAVYPEAKVVVHVDRGHDVGYANNVFNTLRAHDGKFDLIGLSLYPGEAWQDRTRSCIANLRTLGEKFGCKVLICEVGMPYDKPAAARDMLTELLDGAVASGHCQGVFYWEPEAPAGYNNGYTMGAFDNGRPTVALDPFKGAIQ